MPPRKKPPEDEPITSPEDEDEPQGEAQSEPQEPSGPTGDLSVSVRGDQIEISLPRDGREAETLDKIATLLDALR